MHPEIAYQIATLRVEENSRNVLRRRPLDRRRWFWRRRAAAVEAPPRRLSAPPPRPQPEPGERRAA